MVQVLQLGPTPAAALCCGLAWAGFFTNTLEEYYTGELYLGYINMPNEGLQIMALMQAGGAIKLTRGRPSPTHAHASHLRADAPKPSPQPKPSP